MASVSYCINDTLVLFQFIHAVIDGIRQTRIPHYEAFSKVWDLEEWWDVTDQYQSFCQQCITNTWNKDEVK